MRRKLKIFGMSNQDSGVGFYRINQPLRFIAKQKLANIHTMPYYGQHNRHLTTPEFLEYFALEGKWADVVVSTLASDREYLALLWGMRERYRFKLVIDLDDDILATHTEPNNPAYTAYTNPGFRFAEYAQACLRDADMVTVSTEYLKRKYASINPNIVVVKNCIDPEFFSQTNNPDDVTLGYTGSGSHQGDWMMIEPVLRQLKQDHGVKVKMVGPMQSDILDTQVKWAEQLRHPETVAQMGFSIGLAPLKDSLMNRAKSNLRWLEYSAFKIPTVASDVVPFREMENIILVTEPEEWRDALERLIKDKDYRTKLGDLAYHEMKANYDPSYWSNQLFDNAQRLF